MSARRSPREIAGKHGAKPVAHDRRIHRRRGCGHRRHADGHAFRHREGDCSKRGKHVLVEKPFTETPEQARELCDLAQERGLVLQVGHIERFNPVLSALETGSPVRASSKPRGFRRIPAAASTWAWCST